MRKSINQFCTFSLIALIAITLVAPAYAAMPRPLNDFNGDGSSDLAVYHPGGGHWFIQTLGGNILEWFRQWGYANALPVPADYNGDGQYDLGVYDRNGGYWYVVARDNTPIVWGLQWGWPTAVPVQGDYNGDGKADLGVYDLETGLWYVIAHDNLNYGQLIKWADQWGFKGPRHPLGPNASSVIPVPYDFDGDGRIDQAIYYRGVGMNDSGFYVRGTDGMMLFPTIWGSSGSVPVPGRYRSQIDAQYPRGITIYKIGASWVPNHDTGRFYTPHMHGFKIGDYPTHFPVAAHDFDGNGWDDHTAYNYLTGVWTIFFNDGMGNGAPPDGQTYLPPPRADIQFGFNGALPADIFSTIYRSSGYNPPRPW